MDAPRAVLSNSSGLLSTCLACIPMHCWICTCAMCRLNSVLRVGCRSHPTNTPLLPTFRCTVTVNWICDLCRIVVFCTPMVTIPLFKVGPVFTAGLCTPGF